MYEIKDSSRLVDSAGSRLVDSAGENRRLRYDTGYAFAEGATIQLQYKSSLPRECCQLGDTAALRCIIVWMCTVAVVVFVALVVEIISQEKSIKSGDIVTDHPRCSQVGSWVLAQGGNAVDAAVAAGFCIAVTQPHLASIGGGGVMLIHQTRKNLSTVVDFREISPLKLQVQRYMDNSGVAQLGRLSVSTPGMVAGLKYARDIYGSHEVQKECCSWFDLVSQTLTVIEEGFSLPDTWARLNKSRDATTTFSDVLDFIAQGGYSRPGSKYSKEMRSVLTELMHDQTSLYNGTLQKKIIHDLKEQLTSDDLSSYRVLERSPISTILSTAQVILPPPPFAGAAVIGLLNSLSILNSTGSERLEQIKNIIQRVFKEQERLGDPVQDTLVEPPNQESAQRGEQSHRAESVPDAGEVKQASIAERMNALIDQENAGRWISPWPTNGLIKSSGSVDVAGSSVVVMDSKDIYVSLVLSIGSQFGSQFFSQGILMNNALASFDIQNEENSDSANFMREGIRPLSYLTPAVVIDRQDTCGRRLLLGAASPEAVAQVLEPVLVGGNHDLHTVVSLPRLAVSNLVISAEAGYPSATNQSADTIASATNQSADTIAQPVNVLEKMKNIVTGVPDTRVDPTADPKGRWQYLRVTTHSEPQDVSV